MEKRTGWIMACLSVAMLPAACERESEMKPVLPSEGKAEKPAAETAKFEQGASWEDAVSIDVKLSDDLAQQIQEARLNHESWLQHKNAPVYKEVPTNSREIIDEQTREQMGDTVFLPQNKRRRFKPRLAPDNKFKSPFPDQ